LVLINFGYEKLFFIIDGKQNIREMNEIKKTPFWVGQDFKKSSKLKFSIIVILLLSFFSCEKQASFKIGFLYPSVNRQRFVKEAGFFANRIKELGGEAIVEAADDNENIQLEKGFKLLDQGISVLVICPVNNNTIAPLVREAKKRGIHVVAYLRLINNVDYDAFSTNDNLYMASVWCEDALKTSPTGNYIIIGGDRFDRNAVEEMTGIDSFLRPHVESKKINIVFRGYMDSWSKSAAGYDVSRVVEAYGKDISAIITCNDQMADGAINVLKKIGLERKVPTYGQDADLVAVKNIQAGFQRITFFHPNKVLGEQTADLAFKIYNGEKPEQITNLTTFNGVKGIPTVKAKSVAIYKENLELLVKEGLYTNEEIH